MPLEDEPKTNPKAPALQGYVKKKMRRQGAAVGALASLLTGGGGLYAYRDSQANAARQARIDQQLKDHITEEAQHYGETTKRLDQLLELELKRHDAPRQGEHK